MICIPEHVVPWLLISSGLLGLLVTGWRVGEWLTAHHLRRVAVHRVTPQRHIHTFPLKRYVNGAWIGECTCGLSEIYKEPPL